MGKNSFNLPPLSVCPLQDLCKLFPFLYNPDLMNLKCLEFHLTPDPDQLQSFSVAFVLILFSSFTGVRYKDAQDEKNKLFQGAQESVLKLTEKNEALEKENNELKAEVEKLTSDKETSGEDLANKETVIKNMDMLAQVQNLYRNKKEL